MLYENKGKLIVVSCVMATMFMQSFSFLFVKFSTMVNGFQAFILYCIGLAFVVLRTIPWQYALKYSKLSRIYPYMSLVQILILAYAFFFFGEEIRLYHLLGIALMLTGIMVLGRSK